MTNNDTPKVEILPWNTDHLVVKDDFEILLGEIAMLDQIPLDALEQFTQMLRDNFPSSIEPE